MPHLESVKRQILDRLDLYSIVSEHVKLKRSGRRWVGLCPFHSEKTPSFTVSPELGLFKCFGCGKGGDLFSFVQQRENVPFMDALRTLADRAGVEIETVASKQSRDPMEPTRNDVARVNGWAMEYFRANYLHENLGLAAREHFLGRGFTPETGARFGIGFAPDSGGILRQRAAQSGFALPVLIASDLVRQDDRGEVYDTFRNRLMFPIHDATGRVLGFGGRAMGEDRAKYLNTRQNALFDKGRGLYGIHLAREAMASAGRAVVVEGYTDCIACVQAGVVETVASLGTALTDSQVELLRRFTDEVILLFDSDDAGEAAADRAINVALPRSIRVKLAGIPDGKDPCDFLQRAGASAFSDVLNHAVDALEFKWSATRVRFRADTSDARRKEAVLDFLNVVGSAANAQALDAIQRGLFINQVAHLLQMGREDVARLLKPAASRSTRQVVPTTKETVSASKSIPRSAEQAAWTHVLEVLLNEPALLSELHPFPDVERIEDERDRRIAFALAVPQEGEEGLQLADVLARCSTAGDAERIGELVRRGAERGNFDATLRLAVERIRKCIELTAVENLRDGSIETDGSNESAGDGVQGNSDVQRMISGHKHFAPRRLIRRVVG